MTNRFLIKYTSGLQEEIRCGLENVELFCNQHFGSTWGEAYENGATVDMRPAIDEPVGDEPIIGTVEVDGDVNININVVNVIPSTPMTPATPPAEPSAAE